ncbi:MAG: ATP-binding cassette domain-containing protein [Oscillospiraceae bacterium]|nr:ATP-binding cassette domain-containing protein [Oscillospiraceae bacterium]
MDYILATHELTKVYGQKEAAKDVNLHIREGQIYGLIGRNGAGKTTIMRMISGLSTPTRGSYSLFGKTGPEMRKELRNVGVLIEHPGLYPRLSAYENLKIKCLGMGLKPEGYVEELLKLIGLEDTDRKKPSGAYSLGMRQRLGIGLALVGDPRILILDEPINGLDPQGIVEVRRILARLRDEKGITIMISSHILDELSKLADAYGIIHEGTLMDEFSVEELHKRSEQYVLIRTDDDEAAVKALAGIGFKAVSSERDGLRVTERMDETPAMARAIVEAGVGLRELCEHTFSLEDYYLSVTGGKDNG